MHSGISFLTSVTGCQRLLFSCWEICWFRFLKAAAYTSSEGGDYALGRLFVAPQDTAALPACQGLFSTQISCPPAKRADILALTACPTFQRSLWERLRGFAAVYSGGEAGSPAGVGLVAVQNRLVLLWQETLASVLWRDGVWMCESLFLHPALSMCLLFHSFP